MTVEERLAALEARVADKLSLKQLPVSQLLSALEERWMAQPPAFAAPPLAVVTSAASTNAEGPSGAGTGQVYVSAKVTLTRGTWLVLAQATMWTPDMADGKQLLLWDFTSSAVVPSSRSAVTDSQINWNIGYVTFAIVPVTAEQRVIGVAGVPNGGSSVNVGYPGTLPDEQRLVAIKIG